MRKIIHAMVQSLDGYIEDARGMFGWALPGDEVHQDFNNHFEHVDTLLYGRHNWKLMSECWPRVDREQKMPPVVLDFARRWLKARHYVVSSSLKEVGYGATLITGDLDQAIRRLKAEPGGDIEVGGATLAGSLTRLGLIDEYWLYFLPVAIGGGKPYFSGPGERLHLDLLDVHTFASGTTRLRYARQAG
jgi:dihydrofolate reductase